MTMLCSRLSALLSPEPPVLLSSAWDAATVRLRRLWLQELLPV